LAAFGDHGQAVADLVGGLRASVMKDAGLSLVAQDAGEVVGHVMFTGSLLDAPHRLVEVQVLSPVAVLPERQRQGIGSVLIRRVCRSWPSGRCRSSSSRETRLLLAPRFRGRR
jgi:putative acetyltransferase